MTDSSKPNKVFILGVAGGSGSGKTYFARALQKELGDKCSVIIYQDNFYIDQSAKFDHDGGSVNFDHPDSLDFPLMAQKLKELRAGHETQIPLYDFATHSRLKETLPIKAHKLIIVDGILILHHAYMRELFDETIFFDTSEELRFSRRLKRDVEERGRTPDGVKAQFDRQVKPMHDEFVQPCLVHAKSIVCDTGDYESVLEYYLKRFKD